MEKVLTKVKTVSFSKKKLIRSIAAVSFLFTAALSYSDSYKIRNVDYDLTGKTRKYALQTKVPVDKKRTFKDEDSLMEYLEDFKVRLENTRAFDTVEVDFSLSDSASRTEESTENPGSADSSENKTSFNTEAADSTENQVEDENKLYYVDLSVKAKDSLHILGAPYPKYDSNNGFLFKLKMKDTNFMGSLETMATDINFSLEPDDDGSTDAKFGFAIDFDIPFKMGIFETTWINSHSLSYTIGENTPEWNMKTGLQFELPFQSFSVKLKLLQSFIRNLDYEEEIVNGEEVYYGDGTYFVEEGNLSIPIVIQEITDWGKIYYTPYVEAKYNWDKDGIVNEDLMSPVFTIGQTVSTSRVNWIGNFRNGLSVSLTESFSYNLQKSHFIPGFEAELKGYKAFKYAGLCTDIYAFAYLNGKQAFGSRLRGIKDKQYYDKENYPEDFDKQACESPAAIVMNFDLPVHIFTARWDEMALIQKIPGIRKIAKYFNMELQLSPFVDVALY